MLGFALDREHPPLQLEYLGGPGARGLVPPQQDPFISNLGPLTPPLWRPLDPAAHSSSSLHTTFHQSEGPEAQGMWD